MTRAAFLSPLVAEEIDEFQGLWALRAPLSFQSEVLGRVVTAPNGFRTDFASVPRILGIYDLAGGKCNRAAVIHDWLYSMGSARLMDVTRLQADQVLREAILASGYSSFTAGIFYAAVRMGGASHWDAPNQLQRPDVVRLMLGVGEAP